MNGTVPPSRKGKAVPSGRQISPASPVIDPDDLFGDGKMAGALRTIGEVARALGMRQHVLRYWEDHFPMLRPLVRAGGRRYYRPEDIALLVEIDRLVHREGFTLRGARQALMRPPVKRVPPSPPRAAATPLLAAMEAAPEVALIAAVATLRQQMEAIRDRLADALAHDQSALRRD